MKSFINKAKSLLATASCLIICLFMLNTTGFAQVDSAAAINEAPVPHKKKPVKNTFQSIWVIDNQSVMVPVKGTMEMDIQHRFGTVNKGTTDLWGLLGASSNIRLGMNYSPVNRLNLGIGITKDNMLLDLSAKYAIITQTKGKYPVSITYYGNAADDTRKHATIYDGSAITNNSDRYLFFNQIIIARKFSEKLSVQIAPSLSHQNAVSGYFTDSTVKNIFRSMKQDHFAIAVAARYKLTNITSLIFDYDQPITKHPTNNPDPNLSLGFEFNTSGHTFQVFLGNYSYLNPQRNNLFNKNSPFSYNDPTKTHPDRQVDNPQTPNDESVKVKGGRFLIGFNITRLWNY